MIAQILALIGVARATRTDDSGPVQSLQLSENVVGTIGAANPSSAPRVTDDVPRVTEYGFVSALPDGSEVVVIRRNGERAKGIVIATQHQASRPTGLQPGDVWLYDLNGHSVKLTANGIEIDGGGDVVTVTNASKVRCECDIETTGDVMARCDGVPVSLGKLRDAYDVHDHPPVAGAGTWGAGPPNEQV